MRKWMGFILSVLTLLSATRAAAQTTQPAPDMWTQTVQAVAGGLTGESAETILSGVLPSDIKMREFGGTRQETPQRLVQRAEGMQVVSARVYIWSAPTIASDIAADVKACEFIPPSLRIPFIPQNEADAKKANAVAQQWAASVIDPVAGDLFAVIMLWEPPVSATTVVLGSTPPEPRQPLFVFIKGKQNAEGVVQITAVSFGDAKQAVK